MKHRAMYVYLSIIYYRGLFTEHIMAFCFNIDYFIKHKKFPRRATKNEVEELKKYMDRKRNKE